MTLAPNIANRIRELPREQRLALYRAIPAAAWASQRYEAAFWADDQQAAILAAGLPSLLLIIGGRRRGKTWVATMRLLRAYLTGEYTRIRLVASTSDAIRETLVLGPSGLWTWLPLEWKQRCGNDPRKAFSQSRANAGRFQLPGLPAITCLSADVPGSATGQGFELTWYDDPAAAVKVVGVRKAQDMLREVRISTSEGRNPCTFVTTTLDGVTFLRRALEGKMAGVRKVNLGATTENKNLSPRYLQEVVGDLLGDGDASDLTGEEAEDTPGALWRWAWIRSHRVTTLPELARVVVAVDPADDGKADSDETGIVVVGLSRDGRLYVLADYTALWTADKWAAIAAWAFRHHKADAIVAEGNRGWSWVCRCLAIEAPGLPIVRVDAARSKETRAEPLSLLYRDGHVSHLVDGPQLGQAGPVRVTVTIYDPASGARIATPLDVKRDRRRWVTLEEELCGWVPRQGRSPNGLDALVWGAWHLRPPDLEGAPLVPIAGLGQRPIETVSVGAMGSVGSASRFGWSGP